MTKSSAVETNIVNKIIAWSSIIGVAVLLVLGGLTWWGGSFATGMVHQQLVEQKVFFPQSGSAGFGEAEYPDLQKYAGQQVDNGEKAKAYANGFIGRHLKKIAGGKTYSEVSALSMADPSNQKLQAQKQSLFQGETLRGLLLGDAYAYGTIGKIAHAVSIVCMCTALLLALIAISKIRYVA